jgi:cell division septal protein FtsQ
MKSQKELRAARRRQQRRLRAVGMLLAGAALLLAVGVSVLRPYLPVSGENIEVKGAPRLKVDQEVIDMGDVAFDVPVSAAFQLTNVGDQPLRLVKAPYIEVAEGC